MDASTAKRIKGRAPLRASSTLRKALKERGKGVGSIAFLYSAKNDKDIVLPTDIEFVHALALEADESVRSYDVDPDRVVAYVAGRGYRGSKPDAVVTHHSGRQCLVEVKYESDKSTERALIQADVQAKAAQAIGADWKWFSLEPKRLETVLISTFTRMAVILWRHVSAPGDRAIEAALGRMAKSKWTGAPLRIDHSRRGFGLHGELHLPVSRFSLRASAVLVETENSYQWVHSLRSARKNLSDAMALAAEGPLWQTSRMLRTEFYPNRDIWYRNDIGRHGLRAGSTDYPLFAVKKPTLDSQRSLFESPSARLAEHLQRAQQGRNRVGIRDDDYQHTKANEPAQLMREVH